MTSRLDFVDFHTHILPEVDHGCDSVETALKQLRLAKGTGVGRVVLTPHFYPHVDNLEDFLKNRENAYTKLLEAMGDSLEYPDVRLGCEVLVCEGISKMPRIEELCIKGTKTLLLELPFSDFSRKYVEDVESLIDNGFDVVLAHADRYEHKNIDMLLSVGAKIQLNADSLSCIFIRRAIKRWLIDGYVAAVGSDIHMLNKLYYSNFRRACNYLSKNCVSVTEATDKIWDSSVK